MKLFFKTLVIFCAALSSLQAGNVRLSMEKNGIEIDAGSAGKFLMSMPTLGTIGGDSSEKPDVSVSGKKAVAKYPSGAVMNIELVDNELTYSFQGVPDYVNSWMLSINLPGKLAGVAKYSLEEKPLVQIPAKAGTEQFLTKGTTAGKFALVPNGKEGFTIDCPTNWFQLQDNRAKGWGDSFVYAFFYDVRAHPGVSEFKLKIEPYKAP